MLVYKNLKDVILIYFSALRFILRASPRYSSLSILVSLIRALSIPAQIWLVKLLLDEVVLSVEASFAENSFNWQRVVLLLIGMGLLWFIDKVGYVFQEGLHSLLGIQLEDYARFKIIEKSSQLDIAFFEHPTFYDQMHNAFRDSWRMSSLSFYCIEIVALLFSLAGLFVLLTSQLNLLFMILLIITAVPQMIVKAKYADRIVSLINGRTPNERMAGYTERLLIDRNFVKEIRLFGLQTLLLSKVQGFRSRFFEQNRRIWAAEASASVIASLLSIAGLAIVWFFAIAQAVAGRITLGSIVVVLQTAEQIRDRTNTLSLIVGQYYEDSLFAKNLFGFLQLQPNDIGGALKPSGEAKVPDGLLEIEFRKVSFKYPGSENWILRDVSFTLHAGERVALVGENGAGKTTIVKLLTRLYDPTEGEILLNGQPLNIYDLVDLHAHIGVIFQDFVQYHFSAKDNIGFGKVERLEDTPSILHAASKGGAKAVIEGLSQGLDTPLGRTLEEGVDLSGGQWQKLALSRAFMRDAPLLILDEPSSSLDPLAEYEVYRQFADLTQGKTVLFISHRFSSVRMASRIIVLKQGSIIGNGSHQDLMLTSPHYAEMFNAQASGYQI